MGELEDKDLGELTPTGELESPEGVDPMMASPTEPAAIPTVTLDKAAETNFAGNVHAQVPKTNLRPGPPLGPQQRERKKGQASHAAIRNDPAPRELWLIDWAIMGQQTLGRGGEQNALIVMDAQDSDIALHTRSGSQTGQVRTSDSQGCARSPEKSATRTHDHEIESLALQRPTHEIEFDFAYIYPV